MLTIDALTKRFGPATAVDAVSIQVDQPAMIGVIGKSGAGKSTLLRMLNLLERPSEGTISFEDRDVTALTGKGARAWQADCAMVFQQFNLVPRMDVVSNVLNGILNRTHAARAMFALWHREDVHRAIDILARLGIEDHATKRAEALSGGQQQRVAIARALMQDPKIILADEPIASLDPMNAQIVMDSLRAIHEEDGRTVICNLHTLAADTGYGSGHFLAWLERQGIEAHVPVIDHRGRKKRYLPKEAFAYDEVSDTYTCPQGKTLRRSGAKRGQPTRIEAEQIPYYPSRSDCGPCPIRADCAPSGLRKISRSVHEPARDRARAREGTDAFIASTRLRRRVERVFACIKHHDDLHRVRLRGLRGADEQFLLATTARNLKRMVRLGADRRPPGHAMAA